MKLVVSELLQTGGKKFKGKKEETIGKKEETNFAYDVDVVHGG